MSDISDMAPEDFDNIDAMLMNDDVDLEMWFLYSCFYIRISSNNA